MASARLERLCLQAAKMVSEDAKPSMQELDELLADCAAAALFQRVQALRLNRRIAELESSGSEPEAMKELRRLAARRDEAAALWGDLSHAMKLLRGRRDGLTSPMGTSSFTGS